MARAYPFTVTRVPASSLENAHEIVGLLTRIGLPRPSMDVDAQGGSYHVVVHTHEGSRERIMRAAGHGFTGQGVNRAILAGTAVASAERLEPARAAAGSCRKRRPLDAAVHRGPDCVLDIEVRHRDVLIRLGPMIEDDLAGRNGLGPEVLPAASPGDQTCL